MGKVSIPKLHSIKLKDTSNVIPLSIVTTQDNNPQDVLMWTINHRLTEVVIMGYEPDGSEYFASSKADGSSVLWLLARMQKMLLSIGDE